MIRVILIDVDDTLYSFSGFVRNAMRDGFAQYGLPGYEEWMLAVFTRVNSGLWKELEQGKLSFEELIAIRWDRIFKELQIDFDGKTFEAYFRRALNSSAVLEPGVIELLEALKQKYVLCIASNGPYEQQINRLRVGNLYDYFRCFFVSEKIGAQKPTARFFEACFKELKENGFEDLLPEEVMIIGDSLSSDIAGGKAYGLKTCWYRGTGRAGETDPRADIAVDDLRDIISLL